MLIKSHDIIEKLPQQIKAPQHKIDYPHHKIKKLYNIINTRQIIMESQDKVINKSHSIIHGKDDILFKPHSIIDDLQKINKGVRLMQ